MACVPKGLGKGASIAGTVNCTYNPDGTLATVTDAKNQRKVYTYDSYGRITQIARGTVSNGIFTEDVSQRTSYAYSGTNGGFSTASAPIGGTTWLGPGIQSSEIWRVLAPGGNWINNGAVVPLP